MATPTRSLALALALAAIASCRAVIGFEDRRYAECEGADLTCEGDAVVTCEDGNWSEPVACDAGSSCVDGACVCATGERRCQGDTPEECVDGVWVGEAACSSALPVCEAGECKQALMPLPASGGRGHTCVVGSAGGVYCWGQNGSAELGVLGADGALPLRVPGIPSDVVEVARGWYHTCARTSGGDLWCWGNNGFGQLGPIDGPLFDIPPTKVPGIPKVELVRAQGERTCVIDAEGAVWCFGRNHRGEISMPPDENRHDPTVVPGLAGSVDLAMGVNLTCGVRPEGAVTCVGENEGPQDVPLDDVVALQMDDYHYCAIRESKQVACWGSDAYGGLGNGEPAMDLTTPETLTIADVDNVAVGWRHTCILVAGVVSCVGHAAQGQIGNGTIAHTTFDFGQALLPASALDITSNWGTICAAVGPRELHCWGSNTDGGIGDGSDSHQPTPVRVDWDAVDYE
ncbi:MAG: hypothetical protein JNK04_03185 [Myxococcales bacterium]|nr:hypothetical protein [Myxococcales bacterium]